MTTSAPLTAANVGAWLEQEFAGLVAGHGVPGAVVAVLADGRVHEAAGGVTSRLTGVEATPDSVFQIGSITKVWTTTLLMQCVDDGLLDLDLPIRTYLPDFAIADEAAAAAITTRQLLRHTSGFEGDIFTDTGRGEDAVEKYVATLADLPQIARPDEVFSYNNTGFVVAGRILEVLRGKPFNEVLAERLAGPLGLERFAPTAFEAVRFRAATGHVDGADGALEAAPVWALATSNSPAGAMLAMQPRDLLAFVQMHLAGGVTADGSRVLSAGSVAAMQATQVAVPRLGGMGTHWGLGWEIFETPEGRVIGHDGGTIGQAAFLRVVPEAGVAVACLTNGGNVFGLYTDVVERVIRDLTGIQLPQRPVPPAEPEPFDATRYLGRYSDTIYDVVVSQAEDGTVWLDRTPKDIIAEIGEKPFRTQLVRLADDSLISVESTYGVHLTHAFIGDAGDGRAKYIHYGRVIARAAD